MREMADYVLGLGHREIGLLTMRLLRDRYEGLVDTKRLHASTFMCRANGFAESARRWPLPASTRML
jgi:DNA-binding LacI/PurR family transcriptional regulator